MTDSPRSSVAIRPSKTLQDMLHVTFRQVRPDRVDRVRAWFSELMQRQEEVRATFRNEAVRHEQAWLLETSSGPLLVYAVEVEDPERAQRAFQASEMAIDHQHRQVMDEATLGTTEVEKLYDLRL
jgi:Family of unknown function (DUF6176)